MIFLIFQVSPQRLSLDRFDRRDLMREKPDQRSEMIQIQSFISDDLDGVRG